MTRVFGTKNRPRVLLFDLPEEEAATLEPLCGTASLIKDLTEVEATEWDAIVSRKSLTSGLAKHFFVLTLGAQNLGEPEFGREMQSSIYLGRVSGTVAHEFIIPPELPADVSQLVERDLLPAAMNARRNLRITPAVGTQAIGRTAPKGVRPFLMTTVGETLAGSFVRVGGQAEHWCLPKIADPGAWLRIALHHWAELAPERFPEREAWMARPEWQTAPEKTAANQLQSVNKRRLEAIEEFAREEAAAEERLADAQRQAAAGPRRVLTDKSDSLVAAVAEALQALGFTVRDMDKGWAKGDKREDLRLAVPEDPEWEALVEVRGYAGGAKLGDLMRLQRFAQRYERDEHKPPSACWYVVNSFVGRDPSERAGELLVSNPEEVAEFVEAYDGLLLDTADLFKVSRSVEASEWKADEIRAQLTATRGQFRNPS